MEPQSVRRYSHPLADFLAGVFLLFVVVTLFRAVAEAQTNPLTPPCFQNGYRLYAAWQMYRWDYNERLPPLRQGLNVLRPYVADAGRDPLTCPVRRVRYAPNAEIGGASIYDLGAPLSTVYLLRDQSPHPDGKHMVTFLDGHVESGGQDVRNPNATCIYRVQQLSLGLKTYMSDYDETTPFLRTRASWESQLRPYLKNAPDVFTCPVTTQLYLTNTQYAVTARSSIPNQATTRAFWDAVAHPDSKETVGYFDGHVTSGGVNQPYSPDPVHPEQLT